MPLHQGEVYPKLKALWIAHNPLKKFTASNLFDGTMALKSFYCYSSKLEKPVVSEDPLILQASRIKGNSLPFLRDKTYNIEPINGMPVQINNVKQEMPMKPARIFVSYSHQDDEYFKKLQDNLKVLKRHLSVSIDFDYWGDDRIATGDKWKDEIKKALAVTTHAILLVSTAFMASDFINDYELPALLKSAEEKGTRILPVLVKPSRFFQDPILKEFHAINNQEDILSKSPEYKQDQILVNLCNQIEAQLKTQI